MQSKAICAPILRVSGRAQSMGLRQVIRYLSSPWVCSGLSLWQRFDQVCRWVDGRELSSCKVSTCMKPINIRRGVGAKVGTVQMSNRDRHGV